MSVIEGCVGQEHLSINVSLTPQLGEFVSAKVESGRYNSASAVIREALRLLEEHVKPAEARAPWQRKSAQRRKQRA